MDQIYTIGHSNHPIDAFISLLERHGIETVIDVRSHPYSRFNPQFRKKNLSQSLDAAGIGYVFSGKALGARPDDASCYAEGLVQFDRLAGRREFRDALQSVRRAAASGRLCLMCAEKEPAACHRTLLVCRHLRDPQLQIRHILADGSLEDHGETEIRLMRMHGLDQAELFGAPANPVEAAYDLQTAKILKPRR